MLDHVSRLLRFVGTFGFWGTVYKVLKRRYKWNFDKVLIGFLK